MHLGRRGGRRIVVIPSSIAAHLHVASSKQVISSCDEYYANYFATILVMTQCDHSVYQSIRAHQLSAQPSNPGGL